MYQKLLTLLSLLSWETLKSNNLVAVVVAVVLSCLVTGEVILDDRVDVEIYQDPESSNYIYCRTGTLVPPAVYIGSGKIAADKAVECG